jgi:dTDP-glucose 4,6-dehydratase
VADANVNILVTGGAGFIGANFVRFWADAQPADTITVVDALTYAGNRANLHGTRHEFVQADIADLPAMEKVLRDAQIDVVVNFAAESHNSLAVLDPSRFVRTNVLGTQTLLEAAKDHGVVRFHHVSTCEVYGDMALDDPGAFTEESRYDPRTPYNASKAAADHFVRSYHETFGLPVSISNCSNNYGPYQFPEKVVPHFTTLALDDKPLTMYASTDHRREWLHVADHCRAVEAIVLHGQNGGTYNVGSGREATITEIADLVLDTLGKPHSLKSIVPDRPGHDRRYLLDATKLRDELGWAPQVEFDDGMRATIQWYAANRAWWTPLLDRAPVVETAWSAARASTP